MVWATEGGRSLLACRPAVAPAMVLVQCFALAPTSQLMRLGGSGSSAVGILHRNCGQWGLGSRLLGQQPPPLRTGKQFGGHGVGKRAFCARRMSTGAEVVDEEEMGDGVSVSYGERKAENLHVPVLLDQVLSAFAGRKLGTFVDGTLGLAGHSSCIYKEHKDSMRKLIGIDQDPIALELARQRLSEAGCNNVQLLRGNFGDMAELVKGAGVEAGSVDGILLDIGTSSMQLDDASRGFSFMRDGPLDMRMDPSTTLTAADIVNNWSEEEVARVIYEFGEEKKSRAIAKKIVAAREKAPITTTLQLSDILGGNKPKVYIKGRKAGLHPATLTFQGLRIAVNRELSVLNTAIPQAFDLLAPGGRLAVISFHSLEDRIVKWAFRDADGAEEGRKHKNKYARDGEEDVLPPGSLRMITNKPLVATEDEIRANPRSRSAKLRVIEKV